jgi:hypothetical protein
MDNPENSYKILSNPAINKNLQIKTATKQNISLLSADGKLIWTKELSTGRHAINLNSLAKGLYILTNRDYTEKLIVQ